MTAVEVAIAFVRVDASQNPNASQRLDGDPATGYFKSMVVAFASFRRFDAGLSLVLITNAPAPPPFAEQLERLGVQTRITSFEHRPPEGFSDRFVASLFLLDALKALNGDINLIVDPDVLCVRALDDLINVVDETVGVLPIDYSVTHNINGISRQQAGELHGLLGEPIENPEHYGGEVCVIPRQHLAETIDRCERAWLLALSRDSMGLSKFTTEELVLSFAFRGVPRTVIGSFAKRIWTAHRLRQVDGRENELTIWHLPAEKDRGFSALYVKAIDRASWFWSAQNSEFVYMAGKVMGLHHRSLRRVALDTAGPAVHALRQVSRRR